MTQLLDPLEVALVKVRKMLSDYSQTSIASCSEVNDGLLDVQQLIMEAIKIKDKEMDLAIQSIVSQDPITI